MATIFINDIQINDAAELAGFNYAAGDSVFKFTFARFIKVRRLSLLTAVSKSIPSFIRFTRRSDRPALPATAASYKSFSGAALENALRAWAGHAAFSMAGLSLSFNPEGDTVIFTTTCATAEEAELNARVFIGFCTAMERNRRRLLTSQPFSYGTFISLAYHGRYAGVTGSV